MKEQTLQDLTDVLICLFDPRYQTTMVLSVKHVSSTGFPHVFDLSCYHVPITITIAASIPVINTAIVTIIICLVSCVMLCISLLCYITAFQVHHMELRSRNIDHIV